MPLSIERGDERPDHRSLRLAGYDYSTPGAYFVTICTENRDCLFGEVQDGRMVPNNAGHMIQIVWDEMPAFYPVDLDAFVVMPNHIHGIVVLSDVGAIPRGCPLSRTRDPGQARGPAPTLSLPDVVGRFKSLTTARYRQGVSELSWPPFAKRLWQRNYYEHVIRDEVDLNRVREYVINNPAMWAEDENNPSNVGATPRGCPLPGGRKPGQAHK